MIMKDKKKVVKIKKMPREVVEQKVVPVDLDQYHLVIKVVALLEDMELLRKI